MGLHPCEADPVRVMPLYEIKLLHEEVLIVEAESLESADTIAKAVASQDRSAKLLSVEIIDLPQKGEIV